MQRLEPLEGKSWAASVPVQISMDKLPEQVRVRRILLHLNVSGTKDAADTLVNTLFAKAVQNVRLGEFVNISGLDLFMLNWAIHGRLVQAGTAIPGTGTTFDINMVLEIPFRDPRQPGSDDGSLPTELLRGKALEVTFDSAAVYGGTAIVITAGTLRCAVELVEETNTPQLARIFSLQPNSQTVQLDPGIYKEALITKSTGLVISEANVTTVKVEADGRPVLGNIHNENLTHAWNSYAAAAPGVTAELAENAAYFLPVVFHDRSGKSNLTKQPLVENKGELSIVAGDLTSFHLVIWKTLPKDEKVVENIAGQIGAPAGATAYEPACAKGNATRGVSENATAAGRVTKKQRAMYAHLPGKFRREASPAVARSSGLRSR